MLRSIRSSSLLAVLALVAGLFVMATPARADTYNPPAGSRINNPHGDWDARQRIRRHVIRSIYSAPRGSRIRVMSWNIRDRALTQALVRVHRYNGVTVRVLMQDDNAYEHEVDENNPIPAPGDANPDFWWMKSELRKHGNSRRIASKRSWAKLCDASCRGGSGIAHAKMIVFEQVNRSPRVVMYSSGNLTKAAADIQWNDMQTVVNNRTIFNFAVARFAELSRDVRMANPYRVAAAHGIAMSFFPWYGAGTAGDPIMRVLAPVRCRGVAGGYGNGNGRTVIRVSQTAIGDARGRRIAERLRFLKSAGCSVRVLYGLMGSRVKRILKGGGVPIHQLATDDDGDWIYDRYLHQKVLVVNGKYGADATAAFTWNGSANMQGYTLSSDEILGRINSLNTARFYQRWIDTWFFRTARIAYRSADGGVVEDGGSTRSDNVPEEVARHAGIDPYAKFEVN